jgi:hypothetical protein
MIVSDDWRIDENGAVDRSWVGDRKWRINYNGRIEDEGYVVDDGGIETDRRTGRWSTVWDWKGAWAWAWAWLFNQKHGIRKTWYGSCHGYWVWKWKRFRLEKGDIVRSVSMSMSFLLSVRYVLAFATAAEHPNERWKSPQQVGLYRHFFECAPSHTNRQTIIIIIPHVRLSEARRFVDVVMNRWTQTTHQVHRK